MRTILRKRETEKEKFRNDCEAMLIEYLYTNPENVELNERQNEIIDQLKDHIPVRAKRKVIISILYKLMNQVSGEISEVIIKLYYSTGLINYGLSKINSKKWFVIAKGIGELTHFQVKEVEPKIIPFLTHKVDEVRKEAHFYFVNLFRFKGLSFLNTMTTPLSEWNQIQMLEILQKFDDQQICDIRPWLLSKNDTVVLFALKLAQIYNQFEVKDTLIELLSHSNKDIRVHVIEVLTHLYGIEAKDKLKANFNELSLQEQISFFGLLEKLVVPSDEPFVEKHLFHKNFEIQLLAIKILKAINIEKYEQFASLPEEEKSEAMLKLEAA